MRGLDNIGKGLEGTILEVSWKNSNAQLGSSDVAKDWWHVIETASSLRFLKLGERGSGGDDAEMHGGFVGNANVTSGSSPPRSM